MKPSGPGLSCVGHVDCGFTLLLLHLSTDLLLLLESVSVFCFFLGILNFMQIMSFHRQFFTVLISVRSTAAFPSLIPDFSVSGSFLFVLVHPAQFAYSVAFQRVNFSFYCVFFSLYYFSILFFIYFYSNLYISLLLLTLAIVSSYFPNFSR